MPIAKLKTGNGARGLMRYLQEGRNKSDGLDRVSAWESNLGGERPEHWAMYFRKQASTAPQVEKPYLHISLSFDPNDPQQKSLDDEQIIAFGKSYLEQMGLEDHQWVMAVHRDREHPHVHIVVNRVDDDGKAYNLWQSYDRFMTGLREVERTYGLNPPKERDRPYQPEPGERHRPLRDGELTWKLDATTRIGEAIHASDGTWETFVSELEDRNVDLVLNSNGRGITFGLLDRTDKDGKPIRLKASTLGRRFRMDGIRARLKQRTEELNLEGRKHGDEYTQRSSGVADRDPGQYPPLGRADLDLAGATALRDGPAGGGHADIETGNRRTKPSQQRDERTGDENARAAQPPGRASRGGPEAPDHGATKDPDRVQSRRDRAAGESGRPSGRDVTDALDQAIAAGREGLFGGIRYAGCEGLALEEQREYRRAMTAYVTARKINPAYQRSDGNTARQALAIERDLRALVHGRILALVPKPEIVERVQSLAYTARQLASPEKALDLMLNRVVSRSISKALDAVPALMPMAIAVLIAKNVLGALNEASLSEQEKAQQVEEEHRHDREWQFVQVNQHEYERER